MDDNKIPMSKRAIKELETSIQIHSSPATIINAAYLHSVFCQLGLPRSKVFGDSFTRKCGGASILVEAGSLWNGEEFVKQIIPYGALPRIILAWINTYAVKNKTAIIDIGRSPSEFQKMLGQSVTGGKNGTIKNFKLQFQAMAACSITIGFNTAGLISTYQGKPFKSFTATWENKNQSWPKQIILSDEYFQSLAEKAVPLDSRSLSALSDSALAMDLYCWFAGRLHRIPNRPILLHWRNLLEQFGQEYTGSDATRNFKKSFLLAMDRATGMYPGAKVKQVRTGILLLKSPPPIPYRTS
ncbi:MAG: replication protein RepA [Gallionella sp.]|jgi:hypothetical protein